MQSGRLARIARGIVVSLARAGRHRRLCLLGLFIATLAIRLLLSTRFPVPSPAVQDEFSVLLGADTFAHGRLANPQHPLKEFFETIHVLSEPSYAMRYPPGPSLLLALGQSVFGHPFVGVLLGVATMVAAFGWMLQAWVPPGLALLGGVWALLTFGAGHYWAESYWGGAPTATGAALVLGAYGRIVRRHQASAVWAYAVGVAILLLSRPFEGGVLALVPSVALAGWAVRRSLLPWRGILRRYALPILAVWVPVVGWYGFYNHRVTGNALELPYLLHWKQYATVTQFWVLPPLGEKRYSHPDLRLHYAQWEPREYHRLREASPLGRVAIVTKRLWYQLGVLCGWTVAPLLLAGLLFHPRRARVPAVAALLSLAALAPQTWNYPHYLAPFLPAALILAILLLGRVRSSRILRADLRPVLLLALLANLLLAPTAVLAWRAVRGEADMFGSPRLKSGRQDIERWLEGRGGRHVILVRYGPRHNPVEEWVYNPAEIDRAPVIWARDRGLGELPRLRKYYPDRTLWALDPDAGRASLTLVFESAGSPRERPPGLGHDRVP